MDSLSDIIKTLESNPGAGGLTLGTMLILYRIARNVRADNREDNVQRQIDEWYKKIADSVDSDRKSTRLNSSHSRASRMPSSA